MLSIHSEFSVIAEHCAESSASEKLTTILIIVCECCGWRQCFENSLSSETCGKGFGAINSGNGVASSPNQNHLILLTMYM